MKLKELVENYGDYEVKDGFMDLLEKPKPKSVLDLKYGDKYYILSHEGKIVEQTFENFDCEKKWITQGHTFLNYEEAEFERERRKVYTVIKKYSRPFIKDKQNWHAHFNYRTNSIIYEYCKARMYPTLHFDSKETIERAIKEVGENNFIKYYLEVNMGE